MGWVCVPVHPNGDASEDGAGAADVLDPRNGDQLLPPLCGAAMGNSWHSLSEAENGRQLANELSRYNEVAYSTLLVNFWLRAGGAYSKRPSCTSAWYCSLSLRFL